MAHNLVIFVRPCVVFIFFCMFLAFFGIQTAEKFVSEDTYISKSVCVTESVPTPAITICNMPGWREFTNSTNTAQMTIQHSVDQFCKYTNDKYACVENGTFAIKDTFKMGIKSDRTSLMYPELWKEDFTVGWMGRCFTLNDTSSLTSNFHLDTLSFQFKNGSHGIFVHDPYFVVQNFNPLGMPTIFKNVGELSPSPWLRLQMTKHHKVNLNSRPCEDDAEYNFQVSLIQ